MSGLARLVIIYGSGGLSDVGRHAVQAALEKSADVASIKVLTQHPDLLQEKNWNCGCEKDHEFTKEEKEEKFEVIPVSSWEEDLSAHFQDATAVVSCLGNRQPFIGDWIAHPGSKAVIAAMKAKNVSRVVAITSVGIEEDKPCMEFFWGGKILTAIFWTIGRKAYNDLTMAERAFKASDLDYLLVRPVGIGEDIVPVGKWYLQKEKHKDVLGFNMAKLDCARYMVEEALNPTRHREAVVVGSEPPPTKG